MSINEKLTPHFTGDLALFANWRSENGWAAPKRFIEVDDSSGADQAFRFASEGVGLLWRGDFQNGRQLLKAIIRRLDKHPPKFDQIDYPARFHRVRLHRAQRARTLGMLLLPVESDHKLSHRRAPDISAACQESYGASKQAYVVPFTEILGVVSAHEWRKKGLNIEALNGKIHPHYGVFAPTRNEYLNLLMQAPLPPTELAMDIGTGTGVLALLLAKRGLKHVVATDTNPRAVACAKDNIKRFDATMQISIEQTNLFPTARAGLIVCNPPWLPGKPSSLLEQAVYDPDQQMLKGFLQGARQHLTPGGQVWLILSDLAEHLGLRTREDLLKQFDLAGLQVIERSDTQPTHKKTRDDADPFFDARTKEITSLWRLQSQN